MSDCVRSGMCCRVPCAWGDWDETKSQCKFLAVESRTPGGLPLHRCEKYEEILASPGSSFSPAFGAGCSSNLFNTDRHAILLELRLKR